MDSTNQAATIEKHLVQLADQNNTFADTLREWQMHISEKAKALIEERKQAKSGSGRPIALISKELQRELRRCEHHAVKAA